jgi:hypothetical protein
MRSLIDADRGALGEIFNSLAAEKGFSLTAEARETAVTDFKRNLGTRSMRELIEAAETRMNERGGTELTPADFE